MFDEQIEKINTQIIEAEEFLTEQLDDAKKTREKIASLKKAVVQLEKLGESL